MVTPPAPAWHIPKEREKKRKGKRPIVTVCRNYITIRSPRKYSHPPPPLTHYSVSAALSLSSSASSDPGGSPFGPTLAPTLVVRKKSKIDRVNRSSANRSRTVNRLFPFPVSFRTSAHRIFCCVFHLGQCFSKCSLVWFLYWHHPHVAVSAFFVHFRYCPVRQCPERNWWKRRAILFEPRSTSLFGRWLLGIPYFFRLTLLSHHVRASTHFFSASSRLMLAIGLGRSIPRLPYRSEYPNHSVPCLSGSAAACFAHSSAFSLPATSLWAGHHRISICMSGALSLSLAIHFLACRACNCPGPGVPDPILLIAAWASENIVSLASGVCLPDEWVV